MFCRSLYRTFLYFVLTACTASSAVVAQDASTLSLESLMETTVTSASKYAQRQDETAAAVSVITRSQIEAFGWRTLDQALASLPGIHTTYDRQYTYLGTRGFGLPGDFNTRIMLAINGNRLNNVVYDGAHIGREFSIDMDLVERIEFIAGPGGAVYGQNAMFGVVNVITRTGGQIDGGEFSALAATETRTAEGRLSWGKVLDNGVDLMVSASRMQAQGPDLLMDYPGASPLGEDVSGIAEGMDGESDEEFMVRLARGPWSFDFSYGDRSKDDPTAAYLSLPLTDGQYERDVNKLTQLTYQDAFAADTVLVTGRMFWGQQLYSGLLKYDGPVFLYTGTSEWYGTDLNLLYQGKAGQKFLVGVELQENTSLDQADIELTGTVPVRELLGEGYRRGIYVQHEWQLSPTLASTLGLRIDRNDVTGTETSPRAGLIWRATPSTTFKTLYGRAHRAPNAYEDAYRSGLNTPLPGETIDTYELLVDHQVSDEFTVRGSAYRWEMRNILTFATDPVTEVYAVTPGEPVDATGIELSALMNTRDGYFMTASIAHQDVTYESGALLLNSPEWLGKLNVAAPLPRTKLLLGYELQYDAKRLTRAGTFAGGYWLSNLTLSTNRLLRRTELSLSIRNLFDKRYEHPASDANWQNVLEQDGRSVQFRLDFRF